MSLPVLYSFRRCPFAMRARMALDAAGVEVEHREVLLRDKPAAMLDASPKGTVPVLVTQSGLLEESLDIMVWALEQHDPDGWLRHKDRDLDTAARFHAAFKDRLDRYKYASRYDDSRARGDVDLTMRAEAVAVLAETFQPLSENGFLHGDTPSLIDVATFPFIRQFAAVEPDWWAASAPPGVKPWLDSWINSDRFKRVMHKHPVWTPPT